MRGRDSLDAMANTTVLVVDDEANIRDLARLYLEKEGYHVRTAADGETGLRLVLEDPPALLILDLMLPGLDGWEVCRQVRSQSDVPIVMLTARDDDVDKIIGLEIGADDYITKPFNPRVLVARVRAILRRSRADLVRQKNEVRRLGDLTIDPAGREARSFGNHLGRGLLQRIRHRAGDRGSFARRVVMADHRQESAIDTK